MKLYKYSGTIEELAVERGRISYNLAIRAFGGYDNETLQILRHHRGACR
nr:MAG TPA: hypothetical protein [Caudoviricetes sp.]